MFDTAVLIIVTQSRVISTFVEVFGQHGVPRHKVMRPIRPWDHTEYL